MTDCTDELLATVTMARSEGKPLKIYGGNTKANMLGRSISTPLTLDITKHCGIVDYNPAELVITARAGTTVADIKTALAKEGQMLAFEPPDFNGKATLGGTLAGNMSGPARPWSGSIRDAVLGVQLINGKAELLNFGGQVMKNVAGYDVSRLQAGALGTLGVLTQISLKVLPVPEYTTTLCYELDAQTALDLMITRAAQPKPLSGAYWVDGRLFLRLWGAKNAVVKTAQNWGGEQLNDHAQLWHNLKEFKHPFFNTEQALWRFSHSPTAPVQKEFGEQLIDWGGAQRWVHGEQDRKKLESTAENSGGHATLFRGGDRTGEVKQGLSTLEKKLHQRLKRAFDPEGILNPGRLYSWM